MAETDSGTRYPATEFFLRGTAQDVVHTSGGKAVTREAIVNIETVTFLSRFGPGKGTRKVSNASVTFLSGLAVEPTDTFSLPNGQPRKVLKVTSAYAPYWPPRGYTTEVLLG